MQTAATRWPVQWLFLMLVSLPWLAPIEREGAGAPTPAATAPTRTDATGSGYPAPQVDDSAAPAESPATF
jgi:hypothetical protein